MQRSRGKNEISGDVVPARFGDIDLRAASRDGYDVDWPSLMKRSVRSTRAREKNDWRGSTVQNRPSQYGWFVLPPFNFRCLDFHSASRLQQGWRALSADRLRSVDASRMKGIPACHFLRRVHHRIAMWARFSRLLVCPAAEGRGQRDLDLRTERARKKCLSWGENGPRRRSGLHRPQNQAGGRSVQPRQWWWLRLALDTGAYYAEFESRYWPETELRFQRTLGRQSLRIHLYGESAAGICRN